MRHEESKGNKEKGREGEKKMSREGGKEGREERRSEEREEGHKRQTGMSTPDKGCITTTFSVIFQQCFTV